MRHAPDRISFDEAHEMDRELTITLKDYLDQHEARTLAQYQRLMDKLDQIEGYQRQQNGRVATAETAIAVLKDQSERADRASRHGLWGGIIGVLGAATALWKALDQ